jgi:hypothetical protein
MSVIQTTLERRSLASARALAPSGADPPSARSPTSAVTRHISRNSDGGSPSLEIGPIERDLSVSEHRSETTATYTPRSRPMCGSSVIAVLNQSSANARAPVRESARSVRVGTSVYREREEIRLDNGALDSAGNNPPATYPRLSSCESMPRQARRSDTWDSSESTYFNSRDCGRNTVEDLLLLKSYLDGLILRAEQIKAVNKCNVNAALALECAETHQYLWECRILALRKAGGNSVIIGQVLDASRAVPCRRHARTQLSGCGIADAGVGKQTRIPHDVAANHHEGNLCMSPIHLSASPSHASAPRSCSEHGSKQPILGDQSTSRSPLPGVSLDTQPSAPISKTRDSPRTKVAGTADKALKPDSCQQLCSGSSDLKPAAATAAMAHSQEDNTSSEGTQTYLAEHSPASFEVDVKYHPARFSAASPQGISERNSNSESPVLSLNSPLTAARTGYAYRRGADEDPNYVVAYAAHARAQNIDESEMSYMKSNPPRPARPCFCTRADNGPERPALRRSTSSRLRDSLTRYPRTMNGSGTGPGSESSCIVQKLTTRPDASSGISRSTRSIESPIRSRRTTAKAASDEVKVVFLHHTRLGETASQAAVTSPALVFEHIILPWTSLRSPLPPSSLPHSIGGNSIDAYPVGNHNEDHGAHAFEIQRAEERRRGCTESIEAAALNIEKKAREIRAEPNRKKDLIVKYLGRNLRSNCKFKTPASSVRPLLARFEPVLDTGNRSALLHQVRCANLSRLKYPEMSEKGASYSFANFASAPSCGSPFGSSTKPGPYPVTRDLRRAANESSRLDQLEPPLEIPAVGFSRHNTTSDSWQDRIIPEGTWGSCLCLPASPVNAGKQSEAYSREGSAYKRQPRSDNGSQRDRVVSNGFNPPYDHLFSFSLLSSPMSPKSDVDLMYHSDINYDRSGSTDSVWNEISTGSEINIHEDGVIRPYPRPQTEIVYGAAAVGRNPRDDSRSSVDPWESKRRPHDRSTTLFTTMNAIDLEPCRWRRLEPKSRFNYHRYAERTYSSSKQFLDPINPAMAGVSVPQRKRKHTLEVPVMTVHDKGLVKPSTDALFIEHSWFRIPASEKYSGSAGVKTLEHHIISVARCREIIGLDGPWKLECGYHSMTRLGCEKQLWVQPEAILVVYDHFVDNSTGTYLRPGGHDGGGNGGVENSTQVPLKCFKGPLKLWQRNIRARDITIPKQLDGSKSLKGVYTSKELESEKIASCTIFCTSESLGEAQRLLAQPEAGRWPRKLLKRSALIRQPSCEEHESTECSPSQREAFKSLAKLKISPARDPTVWVPVRGTLLGRVNSAPLEMGEILSNLNLAQGVQHSGDQTSPHLSHCVLNTLCRQIWSNDSADSDHRCVKHSGHVTVIRQHDRRWRDCERSRYTSVVVNDVQRNLKLLSLGVQILQELTNPNITDRMSETNEIGSLLRLKCWLKRGNLYFIDYTSRITQTIRNRGDTSSPSVFGKTRTAENGRRDDLRVNSGGNRGGEYLGFLVAPNRRNIKFDNSSCDTETPMDGASHANGEFIGCLMALASRGLMIDANTASYSAGTFRCIPKDESGENSTCPSPDVTDHDINISRGLSSTYRQYVEVASHTREIEQDREASNRRNPNCGDTTYIASDLVDRISSRARTQLNDLQRVRTHCVRSREAYGSVGQLIQRWDRHLNLVSRPSSQKNILGTGAAMPRSTLSKLRIRDRKITVFEVPDNSTGKSLSLVRIDYAGTWSNPEFIDAAENAAGNDWVNRIECEPVECLPKMFSELNNLALNTGGDAGYRLLPIKLAETVSLIETALSKQNGILIQYLRFAETNAEVSTRPTGRDGGATGIHSEYFDLNIDLNDFVYRIEQRTLNRSRSGSGLRVVTGGKTLALQGSVPLDQARSSQSAGKHDREVYKCFTGLVKYPALHSTVYHADESIVHIDRDMLTSTMQFSGSILLTQNYYLRILLSWSSVHETRNHRIEVPRIGPPGMTNSARKERAETHQNRFKCPSLALHEAGCNSSILKRVVEASKSGARECLRPAATQLNDIGSDAGVDQQMHISGAVVIHRPRKEASVERQTGTSLLLFSCFTRLLHRIHRTTVLKRPILPSTVTGHVSELAPLTWSPSPGSYSDSRTLLPPTNTRAVHDSSVSRVAGKVRNLDSASMPRYHQAEGIETYIMHTTFMHHLVESPRRLNRPFAATLLGPLDSSTPGSTKKGCAGASVPEPPYLFSSSFGLFLVSVSATLSIRNAAYAYHAGSTSRIPSPLAGALYDSRLTVALSNTLLRLPFRRPTPFSGAINPAPEDHIPSWRRRSIGDDPPRLKMPLVPTMPAQYSNDPAGLKSVHGSVSPPTHSSSFRLSGASLSAHPPSENIGAHARCPPGTSSPLPPTTGSFPETLISYYRSDWATTIILAAFAMQKCILILDHEFSRNNYKS